jgi:hypothetical protein
LYGRTYGVINFVIGFIHVFLFNGKRWRASTHKTTLITRPGKNPAETSNALLSHTIPVQRKVY